ncbi:hypothetical protein [Paracoccus thiocyanatus]|uniref:hypothetical protein n=1 Tax=Paracoccus thiocyanatus TaxID=34006 RepID=UPI0011C08254|nr:hypothetical protein [Paracoccus thiocyanatus]
MNDRNFQIAALNGGGAAVVWEGGTSDGDGADIFVQHLALGTVPAKARAEILALFPELGEMASRPLRAR